MYTKHNSDVYALFIFRKLHFKYKKTTIILCPCCLTYPFFDCFRVLMMCVVWFGCYFRVFWNFFSNFKQWKHGTHQLNTTLCVFRSVSVGRMFHFSFWHTVPCLFQTNFRQWKFCTRSVELHFNILLHEIIDSEHGISFAGSQLIYCISDCDITKQIEADTSIIMETCWTSVVECCCQAFSPWTTCGSL